MNSHPDYREQKKSRVNALISLVLVLFIISSITYFDLTLDGSNQSKYWPSSYTPKGVDIKENSDPSVLRAELDYNTSLARYHHGTSSWGREGYINIEGWIYNDGSEDVNVTLFLHITDGTKSDGINMCEFWQDYYFPIGLISKNGGKKWFDYRRRYNPFDPTTATFSYKLLITK